MEMTPPESTPSDYLTQREAMQLFGVQKSKFAELRDKHNSPFCTLSRRRLYRRSDLVALIEAHMVSSATTRGEDSK
mgnify:CR=1 FL=1